MNSRHSILRGQTPNSSHISALQQVDGTLRNVRQRPLHHTAPCPLLGIRIASTDLFHRSSWPSQTPTLKAHFAARTLPRANGSTKTLRSLRSNRRSCADEHIDPPVPRPSRNLHCCIWAFSLRAPRISYSIPISYYVTRHRPSMALHYRLSTTGYRISRETELDNLQLNQFTQDSNVLWWDASSTVLRGARLLGLSPLPCSPSLVLVTLFKHTHFFLVLHNANKRSILALALVSFNLTTV